MVPVIISLLRSVPLGFFKNIPLCALPLDSCLSVQLSSVQFSPVQFSFAFLCLLLNTHKPTCNKPTNSSTNLSAYSSCPDFFKDNQPVSLHRLTRKQKQPKQPSTCLADLTTLPALSSPMRPSPQRERSALSSFASNKTMQALRLDLCYEPACLRSVFLVVEILKLEC